MMYRLAMSEWLDRLDCLVIWLLVGGLPVATWWGR